MSKFEIIGLIGEVGIGITTGVVVREKVLNKCKSNYEVLGCTIGTTVLGWYLGRKFRKELAEAERQYEEAHTQTQGLES